MAKEPSPFWARGAHSRRRHQGLGARSAHRLRHVPQFRVVRARLFPPQLDVTGGCSEPTKRSGERAPPRSTVGPAKLRPRNASLSVDPTLGFSTPPIASTRCMQGTGSGRWAPCTCSGRGGGWRARARVRVCGVCVMGTLREAVEAQAAVDVLRTIDGNTGE